MTLMCVAIYCESACGCSCFCDEEEEEDVVTYYEACRSTRPSTTEFPASSVRGAHRAHTHARTHAHTHTHTYTQHTHTLSLSLSHKPPNTHTQTDRQTDRH